MIVITACGLSGKDLGYPKEPRVFSFCFTNLSFEETAPRGAYVVDPESDSAADAALQAFQRFISSPEPVGDEVTAHEDGWAGPELRLRRVISETAAFIRLTGVHDDTVARVLGPLVLRAALDDQPLGVGVVMGPGAFIVYWRIPPGFSRRADVRARGADVTITSRALRAAELGHPNDPRLLSFLFRDLSCEDAAPRDAYVVGPEPGSAADAALRAYRRAYLATEPGPDHWAGPEFHAEIPLPAAPGFLCLSGIHEEAIARVGGPLNLWASIDGQPLGSGVVDAPGPFTMCWPLPADVLARLRTAGRDNASCEVVFATPLSVVPAAFWNSGDRRAVAFCFTAVEFRATRPSNALMAQIQGPPRESRFKRRLKRIVRRLGLA
jgi:hypothetical protein